MSNRYKLTPFARIIVFMLFFVPLTYFGVNIYNGETSFGEIRDKVKSGSNQSSTKLPDRLSDSQCKDLLKLKDREIEILKQRVKELEGR